MKILYFSQFYTPESIAPAFRATDNSRLWVESGNDVTVFTGYPNYPTGKIFDGYRAKLLTEEKIEGVRVLRSKLVAKPNVTIISRLENALSFFWFALVNIFFNGKKVGKGFDVVLGTSGVIFTALLAWIYATLHTAPFVFELRDITYIQLMATGKSKNGFTVRAMKFLELFLCKRANTIVVVTNGFKKILIEDGISSNKIEVITNGVDILESFSQNEFPEKLVLSYFGTLGISQNIMDTFSYAEKIKEYCNSFEYLLIGEGAQKNLIEENLLKGKFPFVRMLPGMSAEKLEAYYHNTELSVITLKKSDNFKYTIPSKVFQVMGRGIAMLFIGPEGETSDIIRKYDAGLTLTGTFQEDKMILKQFFDNPNWRTELKRMGQNGSVAVMEHFSRRNLADKYINILNIAVMKHSSRRNLADDYN
jgi:glycosyltransferase involved in cell wall biosynthesis